MVSEPVSLPHPNKPPAAPWLPLPATEPPQGVLSFYYSEDEAAVAIRAIMLKNNNKSDPNIETATYGLFSTCSQSVRAGIVKRGTRYMFFVTRRGGGRMLTGYYRLKWYTPGNLPGHDFAVAADHVHFIHPGIPVIDRPNGSRPGRQNGSGLVVRKGSPSAPPISLPTARAGGVKGLKAEGFLAKPTLDAAEHAGTARMLPGYGSSRVTRT